MSTSKYSSTPERSVPHVYLLRGPTGRLVAPEDFFEDSDGHVHFLKAREFQAAVDLAEEDYFITA